jgi:hypothetical protein
VKEFYLGFIRDDFPELLGRYQRAYPGTHAPAEYREKLSERVERIRAAYGFTDQGDRQRAPAPASPPRRGAQLALPI